QGWADAVVIAADEGCCSSGEIIAPAAECCCEAGVPMSEERTVGEWETPVDGEQVVGEFVAAEPVVGEVMAGEIPVVGAELPAAAADAAMPMEPAAELLPAVEDEALLPTQESVAPVAGSEVEASVLVEPNAAAADAPAAAAEPAGEPVVHEPLTMDAPKAAAPEEAEAAAEPVAPESTEPAAEPEPLNIFEAEEGAEASSEPVRRWIHARGNRSLVARLVDLPDADSCLLETAGRRIRVPLEQLSDHDQRYVRRTGERLAAVRAAAPARETAGL
ncbi:MAG: y domain 1, partial [Planctomycetota bacterium]